MTTLEMLKRIDIILGKQKEYLAQRIKEIDKEIENRTKSIKEFEQELQRVHSGLL